ncbi:hypothetical protein J3R83DRAFT_11999 [Lanmaoa asiatica]|nr:hypothetical protein J3R83DRAFT_11999 [Lanmaoa asiatica]
MSSVIERSLLLRNSRIRTPPRVAQNRRRRDELGMQLRESGQRRRETGLRGRGWWLRGRGSKESESSASARRQRERGLKEREKSPRERGLSENRPREEQAEREQAERVRIAAAEAAALAPPPPQKGKGKGKKNTSKPNSPIDLADTTVGKSPGQLANTLTSVWGSQSKAVTPAASPFPPSARSMGPTTPRSEFPPTESSKFMPCDPDQTLGEAENAFFVDPSAGAPLGPLEVPGGLVLDVPQFQDIANPEDSAPGHTPADTVPPDQLISETHGEELGAGTEFAQTTMKQTVEMSSTQETFEKQVNETTATGTFDKATAGKHTAGIVGERLQGTATAQETTETVSSTNKSLSFSFGGSATAGALDSWSAPSFSKGFGAVSSFFGGGGEQKEIELGSLEPTGEAPPAEEQQALASAFEVLADGAAESEATVVASFATEVTTEPPLIPEPTPANRDEPPSATEQSTTDNPTDAQAEGEPDEFQSTKKGKKSGTGAGKKKKKGK